MGIVKKVLSDGTVRYYPRIYVNGRETWGGGFKTKTLADIALGEMKKNVERGRASLPRVSKVTLSQFTERYLDWAKANKRSWSRDKGTLKILNRRLGNLRLADLTPERVEQFRKERLTTVSPATSNRDVALIKKMLSLAEYWGVIETHPLRKFPMLKEPPPRSPVLSNKDEVRLLAACKGYLRDLVELALATGARVGELSDLTWQDIDMDQGMMVIKDSKSGDARRIPLARKVLASLESRRGEDQGRVIHLPNGNPVTVVTASHAFKRITNKLNLPLRLHDLRHVAATRMLSKGAGLLHIAALLGHRTLAMSRRYSHVGMDDLRKVVESMSPLDKTPKGDA